MGIEKSPEAFRTISEAGEILSLPAHVLRFWESKFPQIKPIKRAGGRRFYRPGDILILLAIKKLLHESGMTIVGVRRLIRENGIKHLVDIGKIARSENNEKHKGNTDGDETLHLLRKAPHQINALDRTRLTEIKTELISIRAKMAERMTALDRNCLE